MGKLPEDASHRRGKLSAKILNLLIIIREKQIRTKMIYGFIQLVDNDVKI